MTLTADIKKQANKLGFELVGIASVEDSQHMDMYRAWIESGSHGDMGYLSRKDTLARRADLKKTLPSLKAAIVVGHDYYQEDPAGIPDNQHRAVVARYARGPDYHSVIKKRLIKLHKWIESQVEDPIACRAYVDTGPILERELGVRAGLGWFGKNTMLINSKRGSYFFLGILLLDLELDHDDPFDSEHCGTCRNCLDACPTGALLGRDQSGAPVMDAQRCISYLTIEHRGYIPVELRPFMGNRVYGCDICQEVCPWNEKAAQIGTASAYQANAKLDGPALIELAEQLLKIDEEGFRELYRGSPVKRAKRVGLLRNVCISLGNWGIGDALPVLGLALKDHEPLVRGHAAWALGQIQSNRAKILLLPRILFEKDPRVREEIFLALIAFSD